MPYVLKRSFVSYNIARKDKRIKRIKIKLEISPTANAVGAAKFDSGCSNCLSSTHIYMFLQNQFQCEVEVGKEFVLEFLMFNSTSFNQLIRKGARPIQHCLMWTADLSAVVKCKHDRNTKIKKTTVWRAEKTNHKKTNRQAGLLHESYENFNVMKELCQWRCLERDKFLYVSSVFFQLTDTAARNQNSSIVRELNQTSLIRL